MNSILHLIKIANLKIAKVYFLKSRLYYSHILIVFQREKRQFFSLFVLFLDFCSLSFLQSHRHQQFRRKKNGFYHFVVSYICFWNIIWVRRLQSFVFFLLSAICKTKISRFYDMSALKQSFT